MRGWLGLALGFGVAVVVLATESCGGGWNGGGQVADGGSCGAAGQSCCNGTACNGGLNCVAGTCQSSGGGGSGSSSGNGSDGASSGGSGGSGDGGQGTCSSTTVTVAPVLSGSISGLTGDSTSLYWYAASSGGTGIVRGPVDGGTPATLTSLEGGLSTPIIIANQSVYWGAWEAASVSMFDIPVAGGNTVTLWSGLPAPVNGVGFAIDSTSLYVSSQGCFCQNTEGDIFKLPIGGSGIGTPTIIASNQGAPYVVGVDSTNVYWINGGFFDAMGNVSGEGLVKVPTDGGQPTLMYGGGGNLSAPGGEVVIGPAVVGTGYVYAVESPNRCGNYGCQNGDSFASTIRQVPIGGGNPISIVSGQNWTSSVAVDSGTIYWTNGGSSQYGDNPDGTVMAMPLAGGAPTTIAAGQDNPTDIVVGEDSVCWLNLNTLASQGPNPSKSGTTIMCATPKCAL